MFKMINGHIQQAVHFIKYVVEEFEKNGSHVILFSWHSDLVEHPLYQELFVKTGKHMNIECEGTTFTAFDEIIKSDLDKYVDIFVNHVSENIYELFPKKNDAQIADAILELFRKRENLDIFNKKALYIYIREIIDVKTPKITKIANQLYDIFKENYVFYLEHGYTNF